MLHRTVGSSVFEDSSPTPNRLLREVVLPRLYTAQEVRRLARLPGLRVLSLHGALSQTEEEEDEMGAHSHAALWLVILLVRK